MIQRFAVLVFAFAGGIMTIEAGQALWLHSPEAPAFITFAAITIGIAVLLAASDDTWPSF
jgi:Ni/Fe-hydrogenase subunit HybB-like protein